MKRPRIVFYIDPKLWPKGGIADSPDIPSSGEDKGVYCWTVLTFQHLQRVGYECELSSVLPDDGIVLMHRECCSYKGANVQPSRRRFIINIAGDYGHYSSANLQVVQNPAQAYRFKNCHFIPLWPQPGLQPRRPSERFSNIVYYGETEWLAGELKDGNWATQLARNGLNWLSGSKSKWWDYTEVDAVVAVRRFTSNPTFDHKPPSKLVNCWLAGVPAILGAESAYRALYKNQLDFIEVHSADETLEALFQLKNNPDRRALMIENGFKRSIEFTPQAIVQRWIRFLDEVAVPYYQYWIDMSRSMQHLSVMDSRWSNVAGRARRLLATGRFGWI
jgi:hypothetical protein